MKTHLAVLMFLYSFNSNAQLGWYAVPGAPVTPRFEDMTFVGNTGWVAENYNIPANGIIIHKTLDAGDTWSITDTISGPNHFARSIEFINDSIGFVGMLPSGGITAGIYRTTDGGQTFSYINDPALDSLSGVCGMAHFGNTITGVGIYDGQQNFYKSTDAGLTWTVKKLDSLTNGLVDCYMLNDSVYIICGQSTIATNAKACILKSFDGGATWNKLIQATGPDAGWAWKINFTGNGKGMASIQGSENIFLTTDSGNTWVESFVGTCSGPSEEFGGTAFLNDTLGWVGQQYFNHCFFETRDGGATWTAYTFGEAFDRMVVLDSVTVVAAGNTIYKYSFDSIGTSSIPDKLNEPDAFLKVNPNPVNDLLNVDVDLKHPTLVNISIVNYNGQIIKKIPAVIKSSGLHSFKINTAELPDGNYIVWLLTHTARISEKFQVVH